MDTIPATETLYHTDTRLFTFPSATLVAITPYTPQPTSQHTTLHQFHDLTWTQGEYALAFDKTIFHPFGGGQESDVGSASFPSSSPATTTFTVRQVRFHKPTGAIWHYGSFQPSPVDTTTLPHPGATCTLSIDPTIRIRNARLHSAGHLIDLAMIDLGLLATTPAPDSDSVPGAKPQESGSGANAKPGKGKSGFASGKGNHTPGDSWVEYDGKIPEGWLPPRDIGDRDAQPHISAQGHPQASPAADPAVDAANAAILAALAGAGGASAPTKGKGAKPSKAAKTPSLPPIDLPATLPGLLTVSLHRILRAHRDTTTSASVLSYTDAAALCGGSLPVYIPRSSAPRIVVLAPGAVGCPCGGTHVGSVGELWKEGAAEGRNSAVRVVEVTLKKGKLRIRYEVDEA
ncbi:hypothetical protein M427DRAFT_54242 [Gonapodya prolifera JEL478]|uniref:Threonyl/alanyl tRNA synthetase SAD domain-containing protein n=1 Tax=Gonapodya prolifera (strain JEL478) TaxID=1344416 RepID=A0A139AN46_GONPJ|nr:hypothetical protein M427DRAFT_54242 [Gonapodya prolifera JEL478]|eukprot:KXS18034.1 hypothetical protein M427DRAFT_54242 [Gonapodya prolifera JEL478]